jgi:hypothetical protein
MTIFGGFSKKNNVMLIFLQKLAVIWVNFANFFTIFFGENIFQIKTSVPDCFFSEEKRSLKHPLLSGSSNRGLHADLLEELKDFAQNGAKRKMRQHQVHNKVRRPFLCNLVNGSLP